jgi:methylmalonyl-CoA mutase N-terminal domain/subunit
LRISQDQEKQQRARLEKVRTDRNSAAVAEALSRLSQEAADPEINLMPALVDASCAYVSLGEMMSALGGVFGRHVEVPVI